VGVEDSGDEFRPQGDRLDAVLSQYAPGTSGQWKARARVLSMGAVGLTLLHLDFWRTQRGTLLLGWIPDELLYRLIYILLAGAYILWICAWLPDADEPGG
jgi:hypothetical protein